MKRTEYEQLLQANERTLWDVTDKYGRLVKYVQNELWERAAMTMTPDCRADAAEKLASMGCEVKP